MTFRFYRSGLLACTLLAVTVSAEAATTGTLPLSGAVSQACSISVTPQAVSTALDLAIAQTALVVASVTETCNDRAGYKVTLDTANGTTTGLFKGATGGNTDTLSYTVLYNGVTETFTAGSVQVTNVTSRTPAGGVAKAVAVTYASGAGLNADSYADTLTVTLTAN